MFFHKQETSDVCLVLEGTYPYVSGGVSTWVHQLVTSMPETRFAIFHLGSTREACATRKYEVPPNVTPISDVLLFDHAASLKLRASVPSSWSSFYTTLRKLCVRLPRGDAQDFEILRGLFHHIATHKSVAFETFWEDRETWTVLRELYERYAPDEPFIDFYWTTCFLVKPLWVLARGMAQMPPARIYHTACTGYAGLAAALAAAQAGAPLIVSEHGIYLRERIADICRSAWIPDRATLLPGLAEPLSCLRRMWIGFFDLLGRLCYQRAGAIVSLFEKNAAAQRHFGAEAEKMLIIPNGIRAEECDRLRRAREERRAAAPGSKVTGFLGRVVSIKDVKTLLLAARKVCDRLPEARFLIAGPTEEEPEYHRECLDLQRQLGLQDAVSFIGPVNRDEFLPRLDLMILTSVSEGLPFVVIEALAAGVPVVSTDVGACSEILGGRADESPPLGAAGLVAEVGAADDLAAACVRVLTDDALMAAMSEAGRQRAARCYHERDVIAAYRRLYDTLAPAAQAKAA